MVKVVHISYWDISGGAAIAANRLHNIMLQNGIDSSMLVFDKRSHDKTIFSLRTQVNNIKLQIYNHISSFLLKKYRPFIGNFSINCWGLDINDHPLIREANVVYIHWINNSMLSLYSIKKILNKNKIVIYFLHDMYTLTGGCHHSLQCDRFIQKCGRCSMLNSKFYYDISFIQLKLKKYCLVNYSNLIIVSPSNWLASCASISSLFKRAIIKVIPNPIDTEYFHLINSDVARNQLGLPMDKKILLFGADRGTNNPYKGWNYLREVLLSSDFVDKEYALVVFGGECNDIEISKRFEIYNMGVITDFSVMNLLYCASDVFIMPSMAEAFGQTALEAITCGTPVVAFNIGGLPDIIVHKKTGYLADYQNFISLKEGIEWCLGIEDRVYFYNQCRQYVISNFSSSVIFEKHLSLINSIISDD